MNPLNLPQYDIKVMEKDGKRLILDELRRKYVALTPEEWVRQHFVHFLMEHRNYPSGLLANEVELKIGDKRLRCDSILYNKEAHPQMIIEYKAPHITLTQKVFDQISAYNLLLHVDYLIVSNGLQHICCRMDYAKNTYRFLQEIPTYEEVMSDK
ncbi:MAG: type I restriction enzyme HsdR N-terminal domain-containing protein [Prevotella sp.]|nr:type I restriction enzyme HsdR N-terminal domain-containing protein [Prevotella sp.]MBQ6730216.1 type I restriction enzyme HsdR N-terminal domain-containing protein [Bacteroidales bacterium]